VIRQTRPSEELGVVKSKNVDKDTKVQIISKEEMKELLGRSPDYADTLMMRSVVDLAPDRQDAFVVVC
jgi:phage terminase large subunit